MTVTKAWCRERRQTIDDEISEFVVSTRLSWHKPAANVTTVRAINIYIVIIIIFVIITICIRLCGCEWPWVMSSAHSLNSLDYSWPSKQPLVWSLSKLSLRASSFKRCAYCSCLYATEFQEHIIVSHIVPGSRYSSPSVCVFGVLVLVD